MSKENAVSAYRCRRPDKIPGHSMYADWAIPGYEYAFLATQMLLQVQRDAIQVPLCEICAKPGNWFGGDDFRGSRYARADTSIPGMLVAGMPNPCGLPYRMIDGRRRLHKLLSSGRASGAFIVFTWQEVKSLIIPVEIDPRAPATPRMIIRMRGRNELGSE